MERTCDTCWWYRHHDCEEPSGKECGNSELWTKPDTVTLPRERLRLEILLALNMGRIGFLKENDDKYADRILAELEGGAQ